MVTAIGIGVAAVVYVAGLLVTRPKTRSVGFTEAELGQMRAYANLDKPYAYTTSYKGRCC